ncbi:MAG: SRPBCC family protein [Bacteroidota bacterium]
MNSLIQRISIGIVALVLLFLIVGKFLPSKHHVERSITINTPASVVFAEVNCYKNFNNWSPWANIDPNGKVSYEGPEAGVGSKMIWSSKNSKVGNGTQTIVVSEPYNHILVDLQFDGFKGKVTAGWKFDEIKAEETLVTWSNDSHNQGGIFSKYLDIIIQRQIGKSYEQGLKNLKSYVENLYTQQKATPAEAGSATAKPAV